MILTVSRNIFATRIVKRRFDGINRGRSDFEAGRITGAEDVFRELETKYAIKAE